MRIIKLIPAISLCLAIAAFGAVEIKAQQAPDPDFKPPIEKPAYAEDKGPVVLIDEAHFNFHTASGRYQSSPICSDAMVTSCRRRKKNSARSP